MKSSYSVFCPFLVCVNWSKIDQSFSRQIDLDLPFIYDGLWKTWMSEGCGLQGEGVRAWWEEGWQGAGEVGGGVVRVPEREDEASGPLSGSANYNKNARA